MGPVTTATPVTAAASAGAIPQSAASSRRVGKPNALPARPLLSQIDSARECDRLLEELRQIGLADELAAWAHRILPLKNTLREEDARRLENAFAAKFPDIAPSGNESASVDSTDQGAARGTDDTLPLNADKLPAAGTAPVNGSLRSKRRRPIKPAADATRIDKSVLAFPEPRRIRDKEHLRFVATHPCLACGRTPSDAHHIRFAQLRALGRKVSDEFTVPLCRSHHDQLHQTGDEQAFWSRHKIDAMPVAHDLWRKSRAPGARASEIT